METQARSMDSDMVTFTFRLHYACHMGQSVYVVGNIAELGKWDFRKGIRLEWHHGHEWIGKLVYSVSQATSIIEYKYLIANTEPHPNEKPFRWEDGYNRRLNVHDYLKKPSVMLNDLWEHVKVTIRLIHETYEPPKCMYIQGNIKELGANTRVPEKMEIVLKRHPISHDIIPMWQIVFYMRSTQTNLRYRYVISDEVENKSIWEREPDRYIHFLHLESNGPDTKPIPNKKERVLFTYFKNEYKIVDADFVAEFYFTKIDTNIYLGPYPQDRNEINFIHENGIRCVLNLQTEEDMRFRSVHWPEFLEYYQRKGIAAVNFQIGKEFDEVGCGAAEVLNNLVKKYFRVYVHCTSGTEVAPQIVVLYFVMFRSMQLDEAYNLVKELRPVANMDKRLLMITLKRSETQKDGPKRQAGANHSPRRFSN
eukprot:TRINITY_DN19538_c0_g1_i2.p1 TRINITY_DN19538_c0_g1~~TRINITY_DN19538_c0_g1_i2.p1  ORF type:complete len:422 (-),score=25.79 TRINITY_DN19538_c0_g1_i2:13-1278(-)